MAIDYKKILPESASAQLLRTNPKLTGNVMLTVDSVGDMFLDSIEVNEELTKDVYKKRPVELRQSHAANLYRFFNAGRTPNKIIFDMKKAENIKKFSKDFKDQYDFSEYYSGAKYLKNKFYGERFSYFAPLKMGREIPDAFVIVRVDGPMNYSIDESRQKYPHENEEYFYKIIKDSTIVKTFDLSNKSNIGQYIRSLINDPDYPKDSLNVSFDKEAYTFWSGLSTTSGTLTSKGEQLYDFYRDDYPLKYFEEYLLLGYERNSIIYPYIMNLNFLFDDEYADEYRFNRYMGFYVNKIKLDEFDIDLKAMYDDRVDLGNAPLIKREYADNEDVELIQENDEGVVLPVKGASSEVPYNEFVPSQDKVFLTYVTDRFGGLHLPNTTEPFESDSPSGGTTKVRFSDTTLDVGSLFGPGDDFIQDVGNRLFIDGFSHNDIQVNSNFIEFDTIRIYHSLGSKTAGDGAKYDELICIEDPLVGSPGDTYVFYNAVDTNQSPPIELGDLYYFNGVSNNEQNQAAQAIADLVNSIEKGFFNAYRIGDKVILKTIDDGEYDSRYAIEFVPHDGDFSKVTIYGKTGDELDGQRIYFSGGTDDSNRLRIDAEYEAVISNRFDNLLLKTEEGWSRLAGMSRYADAITSANLSQDSTRDAFREDYEDNLVLDTFNSPPYVRERVYNIKERFTPEFGLLSIFPVKDFDYDFYNSNHTRFPVWELYKFFYLPADKDVLQSGVEYEVIGSGSVNYDGVEYSAGATFTAGSAKYYSVASGSPILIYAEGSDNDVPIYDKHEALVSFQGYQSLREPTDTQEGADADIFKYRDKFISNILSSEYHYYKENFVRDFAYTSRLAPYIVKWGGRGTDARDNPYRLNANIMFGIDNFSPNFYNKTQDPSKMTHEWYYLEGAYDFIQDPSIIKKNYCYFDRKLDLDQVLEGGEDEFLDYFVYTPTFESCEIGNRQHRYSTVRYNKDIGKAETLFRGARIIFKDVANKDVLGADGKPLFRDGSKRFDGYKFTAILRGVEEDINQDGVPPIRIRFVEQAAAKFVIMVVEVSIGSKNDVLGPFPADFVLSNVPESSPNVDNENYFLAETGSPGIYNYQRINGDYRVGFDNEVSDLTYLFLYTANHKKFNNELTSFSNIRLSGKYNFSNRVPDAASPFKIALIESDDYPNYDYNVLDEVKTFGGANYINMHNPDLGIDFFGSLAPIPTDPVDEIVNILTGSTQRSLIYEYDTSSEQPVFINKDLVPVYVMGGLSQNFWAAQVYKQIGGGINYFSSLLPKVSFGNIREYVNNFNPIIEYSTHGGQDDTFYVEFVSPSEIMKRNVLVPTNDELIPDQFQSAEVVGFEFRRMQVAEYLLQRHHGGYEPVTKDVVNFKTTASFSIGDIKYANVCFNTSLEEFGVISGFSRLKVSSEKILTLQSDTRFEPVYELIDETPIDYGDFNIFLGDWEWGFHRQYITKSTSVDAAGSRRIEEDDTFLNKVMKLPEAIRLDDYSVDVVPNVNDVDLVDYELVYSESDTFYEGFINMENVIVRYMLENGIANDFNEYLRDGEEYIGALSLNEYIDQYLRINLVPLYGVDESLLYRKQDKQAVGTLEFVSLTDQQRVEREYKEGREVEVSIQEGLVIRFKINKNINYGIKISPFVKMKLI